MADVIAIHYTPEDLFAITKNSIAEIHHHELRGQLTAHFPAGITIRFAVTFDSPTIH